MAKLPSIRIDSQNAVIDIHIEKAKIKISSDRPQMKIESKMPEMTIKKRDSEVKNTSDYADNYVVDVFEANIYGLYTFSGHLQGGTAHDGGRDEAAQTVSAIKSAGIKAARQRAARQEKSARIDWDKNTLDIQWSAGEFSLKWENLDKNPYIVVEQMHSVEIILKEHPSIKITMLEDAESEENLGYIIDEVV